MISNLDALTLVAIISASCIISFIIAFMLCSTKNNNKTNK